MEHEVERYRRPTRILHWVHTGAFIVLFLTGLVLFVPPLAILAQDGWTRLIHRIAAVVFVVAPVIYLSTNWKAAWRGVKDAFAWGPEDTGWFVAAPRYYFLSDETAMPSQGHLNTGQKMWWLMTIVFSLLFTITGFIMWVLKTASPHSLLQASVFFHDIAFIATIPMLFVHVHLSLAHPLMGPLDSGAWSSMYRGKVSAEYALSHHARWYDEVLKAREAEAIRAEATRAAETREEAGVT